MSSRDYKRERNMVVQRWYGCIPGMDNPRRSRQWSGDGPIEPDDGYGIEAPPNLPFPLVGHCLAWRYNLNDGGYGVQEVDGKQELVHRAVFRQTRPGGIPEGKNIHHLCDRPYCFQPSHLYAGVQQDNSDDSRLFKSTDFISAWGRANLFHAVMDDSPLAQRLRSTERQDGTHPWMPVEHPPQRGMDSFVCEEHDYSIPSKGGDTRICRICDEFEPWEDFKLQAGVLIDDLWPSIRAVPEIVTAIFNSEFMSDELARDRASAYRRCHEMGSRHANLRVCDCYHCSMNRRAFSASVSKLPAVMLDTIDSSEGLREDIRATVFEANLWAMEYMGGRVDLSPEQTTTLQEHVCVCADGEIRNTEKLLESILGGAIYHLNAMTPTDAVASSVWNTTIFVRASRMMVGPNEEVEYLSTVADKAASLCQRLMTSLEPRIDGQTNVAVLGGLLVGLRTTLMEHIRFQVTGFSSSQHVRPHPHSDCIRQIRESGVWSPIPPFSPFQEGEGYRASYDMNNFDLFSGPFNEESDID